MLSMALRMASSCWVVSVTSGSLKAVVMVELEVVGAGVVEVVESWLGADLDVHAGDVSR